MDAELLKRAEAQANLCRTFNNTRRVLILWTLADQEKSVSEIAEAIGATVPNTSQHLQVMKDRGVLVSRREGQAIYYRVADLSILIKCDTPSVHSP